MIKDRFVRMITREHILKMESYGGDILVRDELHLLVPEGGIHQVHALHPTK